MSVRPLYQDAFAPVLFSSPPLAVTGEQLLYLDKVMDIVCSDSQFRAKAELAFRRILTGGSVKVPTVTSLVPNSAELGDPSFTIHVKGTNFTPLTKIIWNGSEEPTTYVNATEVSTGVDMTTVSVPSVVSVQVLSEDGVLSNAMDFTFVAVQVQLASKEKVLNKEKK